MCINLYIYNYSPISEVVVLYIVVRTWSNCFLSNSNASVYFMNTFSHRVAIRESNETNRHLAVEIFMPILSNPNVRIIKKKKNTA